MKKYRVIIWGMGNVAEVAVRMCIDKESLELVGAIDVSPSKVGKDAGEVFGLAKTGVIISDNVDEVFAIDADVLLVYIPSSIQATGSLQCNADAIARALRSKKNVITTLPLSYPWTVQPELAETIDKAAKEAGVTFLQMGIMPGQYSSYFPMVIAGSMERVDKVVIDLGEDDKNVTSSFVHQMGYGVKLEDFIGAHSKGFEFAIATYYRDGVYEIADRLGWKFTKVYSSMETYTTPIKLTTKFKETIEAGTVCANVVTIHGMVGDEEKITLSYTFKICDDLVPNPPLNDRILLEGSPTIEMKLKGYMSFETTTAPGINAIPLVVAAEPGFKSALDLPVIVPIA